MDTSAFSRLRSLARRLTFALTALGSSCAAPNPQSSRPVAPLQPAASVQLRFDGFDATPRAFPAQEIVSELVHVHASRMCLQSANVRALQEPRCVTLPDVPDEFIWLPDGRVAARFESDRVAITDGSSVRVFEVPGEPDWRALTVSGGAIGDAKLYLEDDGSLLLLRCIAWSDDLDEGRSVCAETAAVSILEPGPPVPSDHAGFYSDFSSDVDGLEYAFDGGHASPSEAIEVDEERTATGWKVSCTRDGVTSTFERAGYDGTELSWIWVKEGTTLLLMQFRWYGVDDFRYDVYLADACEFPPRSISVLLGPSGFWAALGETTPTLWYLDTEVGRLTGSRVLFRPVPAPPELR
jgi:hypothetical protein